jgi:adenylate cyclase
MQDFYLFVVVGVILAVLVIVLTYKLVTKKKTEVAEEKSVEIERKFLVTKIPDYVKLGAWKEIHQTYLVTGDEEIRIRASRDIETENYTMTKKKGAGMVREEIEFEIFQSSYDQLLSPTLLLPLIKRRFRILQEDHIFDLDFYQNAEDSQLVTVEIEFNSVSEAESFIPLDWFTREITEDKSYKNQNLWKAIQIKH